MLISARHLFPKASRAGFVPGLVGDILAIGASEDGTERLMATLIYSIVFVY